ncbi:MAG: hypothetical protein ACRDM9_01230 [Gaiellaceae bacterium]
MRSAATWVVVGALGILGLLAGVDALRGGEDVRPAARETTTERRSELPPETTSGPPQIDGRLALSEGLASVGIEGTLYLTDTECRLWALSLPAVEWEWQRSAPAEVCSFALPPEGGAPLFGRAAWSPMGDLGAVDVTSVIAGAAIEVLSPATGWAHRFRGARPDFRPDGTLTFVLSGELWEWSTGPCRLGAERVVFRGRRAVERCARVVLSRGQLQRALRRKVPALREPSLSEAVWLDRRTAVVLVRGRTSRETVIAAFADGRLRAVFPAFGAEVSDLEASPRGTHLAASFEGDVLVFDGRLRTGGAPGGVDDVREIAWPPDERFALVATDASVYVVRPGNPQGRLIEIPISASDIGWVAEGTSSP